MFYSSSRGLVTVFSGMALFLTASVFSLNSYASQESDQSISVDYVPVEKKDSKSTTSEKASEFKGGDKSADTEKQDADCYWNGRRYSSGARICVGGWQGPGSGMLHTCTSGGRWYNNFVACP